MTVKAPTTWFTSDPHFGHANIIRFCDRPFDDVEAMNGALVRRWNAVVQPEDTVYVLGDIALGSIQESLSHIARLAGTKILVPGNHDRCWLGDRRNRRGPDAPARLAQNRALYLDAGFAQILDPDDDGPIVDLTAPGLEPVRARLAHLPYIGDSHGEDRYAEWRPTDDGTWLLCGHVHEAWRQIGRQINVGVDAWNGHPVAEATLRELITAGPQDRDAMRWE